tara:strand:+ start:2461 stop:2703 length:243 start_codon:yes stop_codon:yes gene_type:complete
MPQSQLGKQCNTSLFVDLNNVDTNEAEKQKSLPNYIISIYTYLDFFIFLHVIFVEGSVGLKIQADQYTSTNDFRKKRTYG